MEFKRIKFPGGVRSLMKELWENHINGNDSPGKHLYMVDLPLPTEEEKRLMAANRSTVKPLIMDEDKLDDAVHRGVGELGGW